MYLELALIVARILVVNVKVFTMAAIVNIAIVVTIQFLVKMERLTKLPERVSFVQVMKYETYCMFKRP